MFVSVYSVFVLCVYAENLRRADPLSKEPYRVRTDQETIKKTVKDKQLAAENLIIIMMIIIIPINTFTTKA